MEIYQCFKKDERFKPIKYTLVCEKPTQAEAEAWLKQNGGGLYRNILNGVEYEITE